MLSLAEAAAKCADTATQARARHDADLPRRKWQFVDRPPRVVGRAAQAIAVDQTLKCDPQAELQGGEPI
jgi:hypothetical protein